MKWLLMFFILLVFGCQTPRKDGWIVKAQDGKYYRLQNTFGDNYFVIEIDSNSIKFLK